MTGSLVWDGADGKFQRFDRVSISVGNGRLIFRDQRKLQGPWLADDDDGIVEIIGDQGPDALGLSGQCLAERLAARAGVLKTVLMDQRVVEVKAFGVHHR
jgi:formamidopyrimidine-DNA glycosylase